MSEKKTLKRMNEILSAQKENTIKVAFAAAREKIKADLNLPDDIELSGLTFRFVKEKAQLMECTRMCKVKVPDDPNKPNGPWHYYVYCC